MNQTFTRHTNKGSISEFNSLVKILNDQKMSFRTVSFGSVKTIEQGQRKWKFIEHRSNSDDKTIPNACRAVKKDASKIMVPEYDDSQPVITKSEDMYKLIDANIGKLVAVIDVKACYWNIMLKYGFISLETYLELYDTKDVRNITVGNLGKGTYIQEFSEGKMTKRFITKQPIAQVNDFVRWRARKIFTDLQAVTDNQVMTLTVDEYTVPIKLSADVKVYLKDEGFLFTSKVMEVVSRLDSHKHQDPEGRKLLLRDLSGEKEIIKNI